MAEEVAHPIESGTQKERQHGAETPTSPLGHTLDGPIPPLGSPHESSTSEQESWRQSSSQYTALENSHNLNFSNC